MTNQSWPTSTVEYYTLRFLAGFSLWWAGLAVTGSTRLLANLIPSVGTIDPAAPTVRLLAAIAVTGIVGAWVVCGMQVYAAGDRALRIVMVGATREVGSRAESLLRTVGLLNLGWRRVGFLVAAGLAGGVAAILGADLLAAFGDWQVPVDDPRDVIAADATTLAAGVHGFVAAGPLEEWVYRAPLLMLVAAVQPLQKRFRGLAWATVAAALIITSYLFGALHGDYGSFNVATATVSGLIWGYLALRARSILPAIVGHGTYNAVVFAAQTM